MAKYPNDAQTLCPHLYLYLFGGIILALGYLEKPGIVCSVGVPRILKICVVRGSVEGGTDKKKQKSIEER